MLLGSGLEGKHIKHITQPNLRFGQDVESVPGKVEVEQTWTDDDIVTQLKWVLEDLLRSWIDCLIFHQAPICFSGEGG